jgi:hypothetical protein
MGLLLSSLRADSITLQDGTIIEGKILQANEKEVIIETRFSETITEAQRFPRAEIRQLQRTASDSAPLSDLEAFPLPEDALVPGDYEVYLQKREDFLEKFGYSPKVSEVRAEIRLAKQEQERVAAGGVKLGGRWLSEREIAAEAQQIESRKLFAEMKQAKRRGDLIRALNLFAMLEKQYPGSSIMPEAIQEAVATMQQLSRLLDHEQRNFVIREGERERGMALSSPQDQEKMKMARDREIAQFQTRVTAATSAGDKFPPYFLAVPDSVKKLRDVMTAEKTRLAALPTAAMEQSNSLTGQARASLGRGHLQAAKTEIEQAVALWPTNEAALRLQGEIKAEQARRDEEAAAAANEKLGEPKANP